MVIRFRHILLVIVTLTMCSANAQLRSASLPDRVIVGYWHNWGTPNALRLVALPVAYDVVIVAFAVPTVQNGATMSFSPSAAVYPNPLQFITDVDSIKRRGKKVLISVGGATGPVNIHDSTEAQQFATSMQGIITTYGFDGIDIDLEGQSLSLASGDHDYRTPTSPLIKNFILAMQLLLGNLPQEFMITAAPETVFLQGGYISYGGPWGAYIPVLHALRSRLSFVHTQDYNTGSMYGRDGVVYGPATPDFHVAMSDMLLAGFPVDVHGVNIFFPALRPDQVVIGLPASTSAGNGYTVPSDVQLAVRYLAHGQSFGGSYVLANPSGYARFRGLMTWSINWDVANDTLFARSHRHFLDTLSIPVSVAEYPDALPGKFSLLQNYPNPFNPETIIGFSVQEPSRVTLVVHDLLGRTVATLFDGLPESGVTQHVRFQGTGHAAGVYIYTLSGGGKSVSRTMQLLK